MSLPIIELGHYSDVASNRYNFLRLVREGRLFYEAEAQELPIFMRRGHVGMFYFRTRDFRTLTEQLAYFKEIAPVYIEYSISGNMALLEPDSPQLKAVFSDMEAIRRYLPVENIVWRFDPIIFFEGEPASMIVERFQNIAKNIEVKKCILGFFNNREMVGEMEAAVGKKVVFPLDKPFMPMFPDPFVKEVLTGIKTASPFPLSVCGYGAETCAAFGINNSPCLTSMEVKQIAGIEVAQKKAKKLGCRCVETMDFSKLLPCVRRCLHCPHAGDDEEGEI